MEDPNAQPDPKKVAALERALTERADDLRELSRATREEERLRTERRQENIRLTQRAQHRRRVLQRKQQKRSRKRNR